jgi:hypothetical protein
VGCGVSIAAKTGPLESPEIGKVRGFGTLAVGPVPQAGLTADSAKGEAFQEASDGVRRAKVRKSGIKKWAAGWKCPADGGLRVQVYEASDHRGEAFRESSDEAKKECCDAQNRFEVRFYGDASRLRVTASYCKSLKSLNSCLSIGKGEGFQEFF